MIHTSTTNPSFLSYAELLKERGVKNNTFLLELNNEELASVDPHSKDITPAQRVAIKQECLVNPWYFFREVLRVPHRGKNTTTVFRASDTSIIPLFALLNGYNFSLTCERQRGRSVLIKGLMVYSSAVLEQESINHVINRSMAAYNSEMIAEMIVLLPFTDNIKTGFDSVYYDRETRERLATAPSSFDLGQAFGVYVDNYAVYDGAKAHSSFWPHHQLLDSVSHPSFVAIDDADFTINFKEVFECFSEKASRSSYGLITTHDMDYTPSSNANRHLANVERDNLLYWQFKYFDELPDALGFWRIDYPNTRDWSKI